MLQESIKSLLPEAAQSMSIVERYHQPLCRAFNIIVKEAPDVDIGDAMQMAVKAASNSVEPIALCQHYSFSVHCLD